MILSNVSRGQNSCSYVSRSVKRFRLRLTHRRFREHNPNTTNLRHNNSWSVYASPCCSGQSQTNVANSTHNISKSSVTPRVFRREVCNHLNTLTPQQCSSPSTRQPQTGCPTASLPSTTQTRLHHRREIRKGMVSGPGVLSTSRYRCMKFVRMGARVGEGGRFYVLYLQPTRATRPHGHVFRPIVLLLFTFVFSMGLFATVLTYKIN